MSKNLQLIQMTPNELKDMILQGVKPMIDDLKKDFQPKEPALYLTTAEVAEVLKVDRSTVHRWGKKGVLKPLAVEGRVLYRRSDIDNVLIEIQYGNEQ